MFIKIVELHTFISSELSSTYTNGGNAQVACRAFTPEPRLWPEGMQAWVSKAHKVGRL
ncbi:MAG: hypothetical protein WKF87_04540 [Chryseolinea sp.]